MSLFYRGSSGLQMAVDMNSGAMKLDKNGDENADKIVMDLHK